MDGAVDRYLDVVYDLLVRFLPISCFYIRDAFAWSRLPWLALGHTQEKVRRGTTGHETTYFGDDPLGLVCVICI
jgi:hypothetical protein